MARPVRLVLARELGTEIDGAWWPHTASVASELPELIGVLHAPLGEIIDICINWSPTEGPVDLESIVGNARTIAKAGPRRPRLMLVKGRRASPWRQDSARSCTARRAASRTCGAL